MAARRHPSDIQDTRLLAVLDKYVPPIIGRSIVERARREAISGLDVSWTDPNGLLDRISVGVRLFAAPEQQAAILREITDLAVAEHEDPTSSRVFDAGPMSSRKPALSPHPTSLPAALSPHPTSLPTAPGRLRDEPPTRREPALGPPPSAPASPPKAAHAWTSAPASSTPPHAAHSGLPVPTTAPAPAASVTSPVPPGLPASPWGESKLGGGNEPPPSRRETEVGVPSRRQVADAPSVTRGVFSTAGPRAPAASGRVQVFRGGQPVPPAPMPPPAAGRASPTPPTGMPRVPPTAREGGTLGPRSPGAAGVVPRAPGRIEITHAVPRAPLVPSRLDLAARGHGQGAESVPREMTITLATEHDIPLARQVAREICERLGTRALTQQRLLTIVSELGRNMVLYAGGGRMTLRPPTAKSRRIVVIATDQGPGIPNLSEIMAGKYKSRSGLGLGLLGTKRLADSFNVETGRSGTTVSVEVIL